MISEISNHFDIEYASSAKNNSGQRIPQVWPDNIHPDISPTRYEYNFLSEYSYQNTLNKNRVILNFNQ